MKHYKDRLYIFVIIYNMSQINIQELITDRFKTIPDVISIIEKTENTKLVIGENMMYTVIDDENIKKIYSILPNTPITHLDLTFNVSTIEFLTPVINNTKIIILNLSENSIQNDEGILDFFNILKLNETLSEIILSYNYITEPQLKTFCELLNINKHIVSIDLSNIKLTDNTIEHLWDVLRHNRKIKHISIMNNDITDVSINKLTDILKINKNITTLYIGNDRIEEKSPISDTSIISFLQTINGLQSLHITNTNITDNSLIQLSIMLNMSVLEELNIMYNENINMGYIYVCKSVVDNKNMKSLSVDVNRNIYINDMIKDICDILVRNTLKELYLYMVLDDTDEFITKLLDCKEKTGSNVIIYMKPLANISDDNIIRIEYMNGTSIFKRYTILNIIDYNVNYIVAEVMNKKNIKYTMKITPVTENEKLTYLRILRLLKEKRIISYTSLYEYDISTNKDLIGKKIYNEEFNKDCIELLVTIFKIPNIKLSDTKFIIDEDYITDILFQLYYGIYILFMNNINIKNIETKNVGIFYTNKQFVYKLHDTVFRLKSRLKIVFIDYEVSYEKRQKDEIVTHIKVYNIIENIINNIDCEQCDFFKSFSSNNDIAAYDMLKLFGEKFLIHI